MSGAKHVTIEQLNGLDRRAGGHFHDGNSLGTMDASTSSEGLRLGMSPRSSSLADLTPDADDTGSSPEIKRARADSQYTTDDGTTFRRPCAIL